VSEKRLPASDLSRRCPCASLPLHTVYRQKKMQALYRINPEFEMFLFFSFHSAAIVCELLLSDSRFYLDSFKRSGVLMRTA
jgi:hypothetical protein